MDMDHGAYPGSRSAKQRSISMLSLCSVQYCVGELCRYTVLGTLHICRYSAVLSSEWSIKVDVRTGQDDDVIRIIEATGISGFG